MQTVYLVFVRWSQQDQHYDFSGKFTDVKAAENAAAGFKTEGAIDTRIEVREIATTR